MNLQGLILVCMVLLLTIISWNKSAAYVSVDDCDEPGAHRTHSHAQHSSSTSSRYSQTHPSPSGYHATSSSYMRSGSAVNSGAYTQNADDDLQTAQSVYSPSIAKVGSGYQDNTGGYGLYRSQNEDSRSYGAQSSGYGINSDSHVRQKFERLKEEADAYVHRGAPAPTSGIGSISQLRQVGSSSQYQQSAGSTGNVLGVTYATTGTAEDEDNSQRLVPVAVALPATGVHKESADSTISYSTSGGAPPADGMDFSISQNTPLGVSHATSSHQNFETLKQKAEAFVHSGGPPPISTDQVAVAGALTQQSTGVEMLPVKHTDRNTLIVPVRVTVTREHTVLPNGEQYYDQAGGVSSSKSSSYSSSRQSSNTGSEYQSGNTVANSQPSFGSSSSYSYNAQVPPKVYTVGPGGTINFPDANNLVESSTTSYGSTYSKQTNVRQENVVVPGAVQLFNEEETQKRSNKLFDLVSGYGTFLPAKEEEVDVNNTKASSTSYSSRAQTSQSEVSGGYQAGDNGGYQSGGNGVYQSGSEGYQSGNQDYHTRVSGGGGGSYASRTSGVYPASSVRRTSSTYSSYNSNQGTPIGDPLSPPEVSGSYFNANGAGGQQFNSNYASQSRYGTSGGYGGSNIQSSYGTGGGYGGSNIQSSYGTGGGYGGSNVQSSYGAGSGYGGSNVQSSYGTSGGYGGYNAGYSRDSQAILPVLCESSVCESANITPGGTGRANKYGISSSWSSKSQTVNGKTTESKQAAVTVNDNGKVDTYATHT